MVGLIALVVPLGRVPDFITVEFETLFIFAGVKNLATVVKVFSNFHQLCKHGHWSYECHYILLDLVYKNHLMPRNTRYRRLLPSDTSRTLLILWVSNCSNRMKILCCCFFVVVVVG